ncbi:SelB domain-containing protein [Amycolatopsis solani]|uniref:SelB domain-containing protein n=1 Tax=Amycolatopsis solani TaxID=3028615 RepID=UPI0025B1D571|nr:SelB C-terminal domain-containing protein [Amycolatopsis sp. MEP2-6]
MPSIAVSGRTGAGFDELRTAIAELTGGLPAPDQDADVRLWIDRAFTVSGAGTVVTGTLAAGTIAVGDELRLGPAPVKVRGLQALGEPRDRVGAVARVAVNLRGTPRGDVGRGDVLLTPDRWRTTAEFDVRLRGAAAADLHRNLVLHLGTVALPVRVRPLGTDTARLTTGTALPLRVGDRGLVRDPGEHRIAAGFDVLDVHPPSLARRGAARDRGRELADPDLARTYLRRHGFVRAADFAAMGLPEAGERLGGWCADEERFAALRAEAAAIVGGWDRTAAGVPVEALRQRLGLPAPELVVPVLRGTGFEVAGGLVRRPGAGLAPAVEEALEKVAKRLAEHPFRAPEADELRALGLGRRELAAAVRLGRLTALAEGVVLGPDAEDRAVSGLGELPQPFTVSEARKALDSTRRVMIPLLERLDAAGRTEPLGDGTRRVR